MAHAVGSWRILFSTPYRMSFFIICLCEAIPAGASMIYGTILPSAVGDIGGVKLAAWATQVYGVAGIVGAAAMGRAISRFGFLPVALFAGVNFIVGSLICAWASDFDIVLMGRVPQGLGAGLIGSLGYALVKPIFPQQSWTRIFAALSAVWGIAALSGPAIGAFFIALGSWRLAFYAMALIGIFLSVALYTMTRNKNMHESDGAQEGPPLMRLVFLGLGTFLIAGAGIVEGLGPRSFFIITGIALLVFLLRFDMRAQHSLLPKESFNITTPMGALLVLCFVMSFAEMGYGVYGTLMLQTIYDFTPVEAGYGFVIFAMGWTVAEMASAHMPPRFSRHMLVLAPVLGIIGMTIVGTSVGELPPAFIIFGAFIMGCSMGVAWPHLTAIALAQAKAGDDAIVAGAVPTLQRLGVAVGAAFVGVIANSAGLSRGLSVETMTQAGKWVHLAMIPALVFILFVLVQKWNLLKPEPLKT